jgi:hypothetical protein
MVHELAKNENGLDSVVWSERVAWGRQQESWRTRQTSVAELKLFVLAPALALI